MAKKLADWMTNTATANGPAAAPYVGGIAYAPDDEFEDLGNRHVKNPVIEFTEAVSKGTARVAEAWLFEGRFDSRGRLIESAAADRAGLLPYRIHHVRSHDEFLERSAAAKAEFRGLSLKRHRYQEARRRYELGIERLREAKLIEGAFDCDDAFAGFDQGQYTEFAPTYAGPFNKQLYTHDYLAMHARAFEAKNHNPLAKRIVDILAQYAFGRRFKTSIKDKKKRKVWEDFDQQNNITHRCSKFWAREYVTYGELMIDKLSWNSIDPSTVWDIITDPDDITKVYYYHQQYSTAFQQFTGIRVPGSPGSAKTRPIEYVIRQLPADQVFHMKNNVVSQEKRGRTTLFPVLGWLKRIRDLYNAEVLRAQVQAAFIFDDKVIGSADDVNTHAANYAAIPRPMSVFVHNENIERTVLGAQGGSARGSLGVGDEILNFIATAIGIPKQFFNVMDAGGGSRVGGLIGAEPFEKVIEEMQADFEKLLLEIAEQAIEDAGLDYQPGDVEFIFPSVTKDTTTETITNIQKSEAAQYIDHEQASKMVAGELNITTYDYEETQKNIKDRQAEEPVIPPLPPSSRFGAQNDPPEDPAPTHGDAKRQLKKEMNNV